MDYDSLPLNKYGGVEWVKVYKRLTQKELHSHGYDVKPSDFSDLRKAYPELYCKLPKEEADSKLLALASLIAQWQDQLELVPSMDDPRILELYDPDSEADIPSLGDLITLMKSTMNDICLPIRTELAIRRLERKIAYWQGRIDDTNAEIDLLRNQLKEKNEEKTIENNESSRH